MYVVSVRMKNRFICVKNAVKIMNAEKTCYYRLPIHPGAVFADMPDNNSQPQGDNDLVMVRGSKIALSFRRRGRIRQESGGVF